jgi:hypothetical protein
MSGCSFNVNGWCSVHLRKQSECINVLQTELDEYRKTGMNPEQLNLHSTCGADLKRKDDEIESLKSGLDVSEQTIRHVMEALGIPEENSTHIVYLAERINDELKAYTGENEWVMLKKTDNDKLNLDIAELEGELERIREALFAHDQELAFRILPKK